MPNPRKKDPLITVNKVRRINKIVIKHYKHICLLNHRLLLMIKKSKINYFSLLIQECSVVFNLFMVQRSGQTSLPNNLQECFWTLFQIQLTQQMRGLT